MTSPFRSRLLTAESVGSILVLIALQIFILGIAASLQSPDTKYFFWVCLVALLLGLGLGKSNSKPVPASAGIAALGILGDWIIGARLGIPLLKLIGSLPSIVPQLLPVLRSGTALDTGAIAEAWNVIAQASSALALRFQTWLIGFDRNVTVNDALVRNMAWLFVLWCIAAWMGWFTARRNALMALLPALLLLAFVLSYSNIRVETLWGLVLLMLLLMGVWNYKNHTHHWETHRIDYSDSIRYDNTQAVVFLAVLIGFVTFVTPSVSWRAIRDYLRERSQPQNELADVMGVKEQPAVPYHPSTPQPSLPRDHLLSGGFANSEKIVMTVRTGELPPVYSPSFSEDAPRYYWRSVVYDTYVGAGWVTSAAPAQAYSPGTPLIPGLLSGYKPLHLDVRLVEPEGRLFWSGMLFSADVPLTVDWRVKPTSNLFAERSALLQADMFTALTDVQAYTAEAYVPDAAIQELRQAPAEYPEGISERYLQLPRSLPERVVELAHEITAGESTPYDKAKAIETHLRTNYPYDLDIPAPPADQDVADYFLFDLQRGYCDYYATAMVVLARASGLPARFVSGYAPGSYDAPNAQYIVRELNAHSWAEVFFPGIGWIEFEPTASEPEIVRRETVATQPVPQRMDDTAAGQLFRLRFERIGYIALPFILALVSLLLYFSVIESWWYARLSPVAAIERMYRNFYRLGRPLAGAHERAETPREFMHKVMLGFEASKARSRLSRFLPEPQRDAEALTAAYQSALFGRTPLERNDIKGSLKTWKRLRGKLWIVRLISRVGFNVRKTNPM